VNVKCKRAQKIKALFSGNENMAFDLNEEDTIKKSKSRKLPKLDDATINDKSVSWLLAYEVYVKNVISMQRNDHL
jgi:hypothetical protein